ncbi:MAG TPA: PAS domain S-box protein, partial [Syntrophales bacterium]|nr:PAS domain S-box protein [Syntrophales bacterium]
MRLNSLARYYHDFFKIFSSPSLKIKITLTVLLLFLCSIFLLAFLISKLLESDLIAQIEEQQFSTASYIADSIEGQVKLRFDSLSTIASLITPELISNPGKLREFLRQQPTLSNLFLAGVIVISKDGKIITDYPVVAGRASASVDFEYFKEVVATEKPAVGKPRIGRFSKTPRVSFAVPVFDHSGKLIAVLAGHVSLSDPSLLGTIQALSYKDFPDRLTVVSPKYHMVIAGTDPARVMTPTPKPGVSFLHDKFMAGFEGSGVYENSRGIRMLSSGKQIPAPGWFVRLGLPADIAFAPIRSMKRWAYSIALGLSLLSSILVWLIVRQMLRPLYASSALIRDIAEKHLPPQNIPVIQHDEIGQLITSFNQLLNHRDKTEQALRESENRYRSIFDNRQVVMLLIDPDTMKIVDANAAALFYYGYTSDQLQNMKITDINMASDDFIVSEAHAAAREEKDRFLFRHRLADGAIRDVEVFSGPIEIQGAKLLYSIIHDITERKQAELAVIKSEEKFFKLFMSTPAAISVSKLDNGCLIDVNKEFESVLGFNRDEIIGHTSHELGLWVDTVDRDRIVNWIQKDGRIRDSELKLKSKNGVVHTCRYFGDSLEIDGTPYLLSA